MGQKCHPKGLRLGINEEWDCNWFANSDYSKYILIDYNIRNFLSKEFNRAGVSRIVINRKSDYTEAVVYVSRPGVVYGKSGVDVSEVSNALKKIVNVKVNVVVKEQENSEANAKLIANWIAFQLEKEFLSVEL